MSCLSCYSFDGPTCSTASFQCWSFIVTVCISAFVLAISVIGLAGAFPSFAGDKCFYGGLIGVIIGLWFPRPTIQSHIADIKLATASPNNTEVSNRTTVIYTDV